MAAMDGSYLIRLRDDLRKLYRLVLVPAKLALPISKEITATGPERACYLCDQSIAFGTWPRSFVEWHGLGVDGLLGFKFICNGQQN
jgi:hypothetical protein